MNSFFKDFVEVAKKIYGEDSIPLHRPVLEGNEKKYLEECIDSNFVSSAGNKVFEFEKLVAEFTGSKHAISTVNGTAALHIALELGGVRYDEEVITQALTFVATCNAISYVGAKPLFIDVDLDTLSLSPVSLKDFLEKNCERRIDGTYNKISKKKISACVPMHTFGFPGRIGEIAKICFEWNIPMIEDAAEALGSYSGKLHVGNFGLMSSLSFNGNKIITTGGGGMVITNNSDLASKLKHFTTTAKLPHKYEFLHDEIAYNYRMPNLNAALGCAQIERLKEFLTIKNELADIWESFFDPRKVKFFRAINGNKANHWLNSIILPSRTERDNFLNFTNENAVMTRPVWKLMSQLPMFSQCQTDGLKNSIWLQDRLVNIPSSVPDRDLKNILF